LAVGTSSLLGSSQGGKIVTVGASGCDFTTIQAAIDAALDGGIIEVQTGSYKETLTIRNRDGLTLRGAGPDKVTLDGSGPEQKDITPGILILSSRNVTVTGLRITNCRRGLEADDSTLLFVEANTFENNLRNGVNLQRSEGELRGNTIRNTQVDLDGSQGQGVNLSDSTASLIGNTITGSADDGIRSQMSSGPASAVSGSGNVVRDNRGGNLAGNAPTSLLADPPAVGNLDQVAVPADVATIQEAVNRVKVGGTVTVAAGTYKEKVEIYKSVTLRGAGPDKTILQAPGPEWLALNVATDSLQVTIEGLRITGGRFGARIATGPGGVVTLRNVKLDGNGQGKPNDGGLWVFDQVTVTLDRVAATSNNGNGFTSFGRSKVTARQSSSTSNTRYGCLLASGGSLTADGLTVSQNGSYGIYATGGLAISLANCTVAGNTGHGVRLSSSSETSITSCQITGTKATSDGNNGCGIYLQDTAKATARACTISGNRYGIYLVENSSADVTDSSVAGSARYGVRICDSSSLTLTNCQVTGTTGDGSGQYGYGAGLVLGDKTSATLQTCTVERNYEYGLGISGEAHATLSACTVRDNAREGIFASESAHVDITNCQVTGTKKAPAPSNCCGSGIAALDTSEVTIQGTTSSGNAEAGVWIGDSATVSVSASTLSSNLNSGVDCSGTAHATIQDNTISSNVGCGIVAWEGAQVLISGNRVSLTKKNTSGGLGRGIWAYGQTKTTIRGNTITANAMDGIRFGDGGTAAETATTEISGNTIRGNVNCGVRVDSDVGLKVAGQGNTIADNKNGNLCGTATKCPRGFGGGK
jgi:parallel beta-helix repeat protein